MPVTGDARDPGIPAGTSTPRPGQGSRPDSICCSDMRFRRWKRTNRSSFAHRRRPPSGRRTQRRLWPTVRDTSVNHQTAEETGRISEPAGTEGAAARRPTPPRPAHRCREQVHQPDPTSKRWRRQPRPLNYGLGTRHRPVASSTTRWTRPRSTGSFT